MIKKLSYFFLITITTQLAPFNFSEDLSNTTNLTNPFDRIAAYQNIAKQITPSDSTRLSKKFIRKIAFLHQLCLDSKEIRIKLAFKTLLSTAIANSKLKSIDHANVLTSLLARYEAIVAPQPEASLIEETNETEDTQSTIEYDQPTDQSLDEKRMIEKREILKNKTQYSNRENVVNLLMLKKIACQIERLKSELTTVKKEVSHVAKQDATIKETFRKLIKLEQLIQRNPLACQILTRSPVGDAEQSDDLPDSLLEELIREIEMQGL